MTMWMFPRSVPMYNHLLWKGRWQKVILKKTKKKKRGDKVKRVAKKLAGRERVDRRDREKGQKAQRQKFFSNITRHAFITRDKMCFERIVYHSI